jgi:hypothetical protein
MDPVIVVTIKPDGSTTFEVEGAVGTSCEEITRELEESLGKVTSRDLKPEYYEGDAERTKW